MKESCKDSICDLEIVSTELCIFQQMILPLNVIMSEFNSNVSSFWWSLVHSDSFSEDNSNLYRIKTKSNLCLFLFLFFFVINLVAIFKSPKIVLFYKRNTALRSCVSVTLRYGPNSRLVLTGANLVQPSEGNGNRSCPGVSLFMHLHPPLSYIPGLIPPLSSLETHLFFLFKIL